MYRAIPSTVYSEDDPNFMKFSNEGVWTNANSNMSDDNMEELKLKSSA